MSVDLASLGQGWAEAVGWTLIVALCPTTLLALVVRGLFHRAGRPTAVSRCGTIPLQDSADYITCATL